MTNADSHSQPSATATYKKIEAHAMPAVEFMPAVAIRAMMAARNVPPVNAEKVPHFRIWFAVKYLAYTKLAAIKLRKAI